MEGNVGCLSSGYILRDYRILSVIGRGGFGVVYRGKHRELGIEVAIKEFFPTELCTRYNQTVQPSKPDFQASYQENLDRFIREAQQLENFRNCPNIVTCRDLFRANGTAYIVMDYIQGIPLSVLLERREARGKPFTENDLLLVILPLLEGLKIVHESGVYHRDIKPSNILTRRADSAPILIDFGAAKHEVSKHTKSFAPYSDGYASMEQVGEGEIGPWTDIYGVGAVMWRMVAGGNPPFSPPNPLNSQKRAFELMHGRTDPMPSAKEIGSKRFSNRILEAIDDALIINVSNRLQNCHELRNGLASVNQINQTNFFSDKNQKHFNDTSSDHSIFEQDTEQEESWSSSSHSKRFQNLMTTDNILLTLKAESIAKDTSVTGWYFLGFFLGFIGILIALGRSPKTPIGSITNHSGDDRDHFERAYHKELKGKQVNATCIGCILANSLSLFIWSFLWW